MRHKKVLLPLIACLIAMSGIGVAAAQPPAGAVGGANCTVDITSGIPDEIDWKSAFIVRGADGSAWQRAIVSNGSTGVFMLKEFEPTFIYGTAAPHADVQIYFFSPQTNPTGGLLRPTGQGTCFMADTSWQTEEGAQARIESGYFELPVASRVLWQNLGDDLVIDAFYRLDRSWDQIMGDSRYQGAQNYFFSTHIAPKILELGGEWDETNCTKACDEGPALGITLDPAKLTQRFLGSNFDGVGMKKVTIGRMPGVHTFYSGFTEGATAQSDKAALRLITHQALAMEILKRALLANENLPGAPPGVPQLTTTNIEGAARGTVNVSPDIQRLLRRVAVLMIGESGGLPNSLPGGSPSSSPVSSSSFSYYQAASPDPLYEPNQLDNQLPAVPPVPINPGGLPPASAGPIITPSPIPIQTERPPFVPGVPNPPVPPPPGINFLDGTTLQTARQQIDALLNQGNNQGLLASLFPTGASSTETWASDLVTLISFWTGSIEPNLCLMADDRFLTENFQDQAPDFQAFQCDQRLSYVSGMTPLLLLHTNKAVTLQPDFSQTVMTTADQTFDNDETWFLPTGKKRPLDYEYEFTSDFSVDAIGSACVKKGDYFELIDSISEQLALQPNESTLLAQELFAVTPESDGFLQLTFADPKKIAERIKWRGNGTPLDILQLFFRIEDGNCDEWLLPKFSITADSERDGFEVGVLK